MNHFLSCTLPIKLLACASLVLTLVSTAQYRAVSLANSAVSGSRERKAMRLVAQYKKNDLVDISSDGRLLLFYQTSTPVRSFHFPIKGGKGSADQPEVYDDVLRVVERESGREVARTPISFYFSGAKLLPDTQRVFYAEPKPYPQRGSVYKLWDFTTGQTHVCLDESKEAIGVVAFLDQRHALAVRRPDVPGFTSDNVLVRLNFTDSAHATVEPIEPASRLGLVYGEKALSPDKSYLAYFTGRHQMESRVAIWDLQKGGIVGKLDPPKSLQFDLKLAYTPDGKLLVATAGNVLERRWYVLFYDTQSYQLVRRLEVPPGPAIAISPDSRLLAIGYKDEQEAHGLGSLISPLTEQGVVVVYDIRTGEEVAGATHPRVKQTHNDPFIARIGSLVFTPDGKYLLSSTHDTRVWQIEDHAGL